MKSQIFTTAWKLFRTYQITFSQALVEAWKSVKREALKLEFASIKSNEISYRQRLVDKYNSLKETIYIPKTYFIDLNAQHNFLIKNYENWMK